MFFHENYFYFFMFRDVPAFSGMFWNVTECSMFRILSTPQFLGISYFWIQVLDLNYLTKELPSFPTFQVKARLYVNFIAVPKYSFLDYFLCCCFVYKIFAVTIRNIIP